MVKVFNEENKTVENAPVTSLQMNIQGTVHELYLEDGKILMPSANHPFLTSEKGWANIEGCDEGELVCNLLEIGDHVYSIQPNGSLTEVEVVNIIPIEGDYPTYNFVDMRYGTFIAEDFIVHNCGCEVECFMPGTPVSMADGTFKDIEKIEKEDMVKVYNPETKTVEIAPVEHDLFKTTHDDIHEIYFENGIILKPGADHPFYTKEKGWASVNGLDKMQIGAGKLEVGNHAYIHQPDGSLEEIRVTNIIPVKGEYATYDLANMKYYTYLVADIVTHNTECFLPGTPVSMADGSYKNIEDIQIGDMVKVYNENIKNTEELPVNTIKKKIQDNIYELCLENDEIIQTTADHLFYTNNKGWASISGLDKANIDSDKLEVGDYITQMTTKGIPKEVQVTSIVPVEGEYVAYYFADIHFGAFPTGTQVTMIDGSCKNVENLEIGDLIYSFDSEQSLHDMPNPYSFEQELMMILPEWQQYNNDRRRLFKWSKGSNDDCSAVVKMVIKTQQGGYDINNGVLSITDEQPLFTQKSNGTIGWATISSSSKEVLYDYQTALILEVGDKIYIENETWTSVNSITYNPKIRFIHTIDVPLEDNLFINDLCRSLQDTTVNVDDSSNNKFEDTIQTITKLREQTTRIENAPVTSIQVKIHNDVHEVHLDNGEILKPTANHPFLTKEKGWATISGFDEIGMDSGKLEIWDTLYQLQKDGALKETQIIDIIPIQGNYLTYNLLDMQYGTFLADDIITHNSCCFLPGTQVNLANNTKKNIEEIEIGDIVKVFNEETQTIENASVNSLQIKIHNDVHELHLQDGTILQPTANHPFYTMEKGWASISGLDEMGMGTGILEIGDHVYQYKKDGTLGEIKVIDIVPIQGTYLTYNLVDMKTGTYLAEDVVTHNTCFLPGTKINLADGSYKLIEDIEKGDMVKVFNEETQKVEDAPVTLIYTGVHYDLHKLYLENGKVLNVTSAHPFWTKEKGWADIEGFNRLNLGTDKLEIGDHVYQYKKDGTLEEIEVIGIAPMDGGYYAITLVDMKYETFLAEDIITHNSLMVGTQICLANGSCKNIEDIEIGDNVKVFNPETETIEDALVNELNSIIHDDIHERD